MVLFNCLSVGLCDIMDYKEGLLWLKNPLS